MKTKVMTIVGTRPEIIKLSRVMAELDNCVEHILVHTGQNYDYELNEIFFNDLGVKKDILDEGDIIYLQPKRRKSKSSETFSINNPLTLRMISQIEGIKLEFLMDKNNISSPDELLPRGEKIALK